eukprot:13109_1
MELGLARDMFVNKKNMKRKEWVKMKRISLKWHILCEEHKFEKEKEEKVSECEDICCDDITKCGSRKRIQFVMGFYKVYFLKPFVYGEDSADDMQYIEIFECAFDGYNATHLLNDYFHIETYHGQEEELRDCTYQGDDTYDARCCALLWRQEREARHKRNGARDGRISKNEIFSAYL